MNMQIKFLKGLHPGIFLERELVKRKLSKGKFALSIQEYPQTLGAVINGKRDMNTGLALKIEEALGLEEGFLMTLQVFFDIKQLKIERSDKSVPDLSKIRPGIFWDTDINKINWDLQKRAVIERVFERGNQEEKDEITRFYGSDTIARFHA